MSSLFLLFLSTSVSLLHFEYFENYSLCRSFVSFTDAVDLLFQLSVSPLSASCSSLGLPSSSLLALRCLFSHTTYPDFLILLMLFNVQLMLSGLTLTASFSLSLFLKPCSSFIISFFLFHRCLSFHGNPVSC